MSKQDDLLLTEEEKREIFDFIERHHYQSIMAEITKGKIGMDGFWISREELKALKSRYLKCSLCNGSREVVERKARQMGYTFGADEPPDSLEEKLIPCPACKDRYLKGK